MHEDAVVVVEMAVPELRVLEGDAFDLDVLRAFDEREPGAGHAGVRKAFGFGPVLPEELPDGHARAVEYAIAGKLEAVAALRIDKGGGEVVHEVAFDAGALRGEVREVGGALEDGAFGEAQVHLRFEEESSGDEDTFGDNNGATARGGKLIDCGLDGLGVDGGVVSDCAGFGNEKFATGCGYGTRCVRPKWS